MLFSRITAILFWGDMALAVLAVYMGHLLRFGGDEGLIVLAGEDILRLFLISLIMIFSSFLVELYDNEKNTDKKELLIRVSAGLPMSVLILSAIYYMVPSTITGRGTLMISLGTFCLLQYLWHVSYAICVNLPGVTKKVLILGTGPLANKIGRLVQSKNNLIFGGYINCTGESDMLCKDTVSNGDGLVATAKREKAHKIVISLAERRGAFPMKDLLGCKLSGIEILDAPSFYEQLTGKFLLENITPSWLIFSDGFRLTPYQRIQKRIFDLFFALSGVIVTLPLMPLIMLLIQVDSRGPIFFRQIRTGEGEKTFHLYKFRTMRQDAESATGAVWAQENDPRITRVGNFLRQSRLDELPQLFNVLKGEMSFIGPRPERPEFIEKLKEIIPYYSDRHVVKPGISGWAQVKYPYGASVQDAIEKLRYDLFYVKHMSLSLDLLIMLETIKVVLFGRGGR